MPWPTRFAWDNARRKTGCCVREILSIRAHARARARDCRRCLSNDARVFRIYGILAGVLRRDTIIRVPLTLALRVCIRVLIVKHLSLVNRMIGLARARASKACRCDSCPVHSSTASEAGFNLRIANRPSMFGNVPFYFEQGGGEKQKIKRIEQERVFRGAFDLTPDFRFRSESGARSISPLRRRRADRSLLPTPPPHICDVHKARTYDAKLRMRSTYTRKRISQIEVDDRAI